jgi:hypothetical protein
LKAHPVLLGLTVASLLAWAPSGFAQLAADHQDSPTITVSNAEIGAAHDLRILIYGDMRFTDPKNTTDTAPRVRAWLARKVAEEKPDAMLVTGDIPFRGSSRFFALKLIPGGRTICGCIRQSETTKLFLNLSRDT